MICKRANYLVYFLTALSFLTLPPARASAQQSGYGSVAAVDHIIAVVNDSVITRHELNEIVRTSVRQLHKQGVQPPPIEALEKQLLERLILNRVQLQLAKETNLTITDTELDKAILRIAQDNKMSLQEFYAALEHEQINYTKFREEIRNEMVFSRLKDREVNSRINITEAEIDNFLRTQETTAGGAFEYRLAHIMVTVPERAEPAEVEARRQRAETALTRLRSGADFAQIAAEFSDAGDAMKGGILDWRPATQVAPKFAEALRTMQAGQTSNLIRSPVGFHIIRLLDRRAQIESVVMVNQIHARHILIKISELTSEADARHRITQMKERLDNGSSFTDLAKLHSEDGSATNGGDLGWLSPGDTVAPFEQAMNQLKPGEISQPVQSPFGWHLIQVLEHRTQDVSRERQRQNASQAIRARKSDEAFQDWLQRLRDRAYVELRQDE